MSIFTMEPVDTTYEDLLKKYEDLQLRVTRFSTTQQQLINTRDRLDQELNLHKKLQYYTGKLLNAQSETELLELTSEAIVDILEIELALVYVKNNINPHHSIMVAEGFRSNPPLAELENDFRLIYERDKTLGDHLIDSTTLGKCKHLCSLQTAIMKCFAENDLGYEIFFLGGLTKENAPSYSQMLDKHISIFLIFVQQVQSIIANRKRHQMIVSQYEQIKNSETELRKLSLIATKTNIGVIITDTLGKIEWVNEAFTKITGFVLEEIIGKKPKDILQGKDTDFGLKKLLGDAIRKKEHVETVILNYRKDGTPYYNQLEIIPVFDENGLHTHFTGFQKDITEELQSRADIIRMNSIFEALSKTTHTGIWEWNLANDKIQLNDVLYSIMGIDKIVTDRASLYQEWKSCIHPDDVDVVVNRLDAMIRGAHNTYKQEYRIIRKSDNSIRNCISVSIAIKDEKGSLVRLVGSMQDITEQAVIQKDLLHKNEELQKINAELDHFVYSISHDLRSPLLSIKGLISLVLKSATLSDEHMKFLNLSLTSASRLDSTIQEILEYSRNARMMVEYDEFDLTALIRTVFDDLRFASNGEVRLIQEPEAPVMVASDKARIGVLLKNIIGNSIKYSRQDLEAYVKASVTQISEHLKIIIEDNGEGIPEKHLKKVFDMFYRATTTIAGTGLGLYISREIVSKLKGTISITSEFGKGTIVSIRLPLKK